MARSKTKPLTIEEEAALAVSPAITAAIGDEPFPRYAKIDLGKIAFGTNVRKKFDLAELDKLAESIKQYGVLEPVIVRLAKTADTEYTLISGERRYRAAKIIHLPEIPAIIHDVDEATALEMTLVENIEREQLNVIERSEGFAALMGKGRTQEEIGKKFGLSQEVVSNGVRLLHLPEDVKTLIIDGKLSGSHGEVLVSLITGDGSKSARETCIRLANEAAEFQWSKKTLASAVGEYKDVEKARNQPALLAAPPAAAIVQPPDEPTALDTIRAEVDMEPRTVPIPDSFTGVSEGGESAPETPAEEPETAAEPEAEPEISSDAPGTPSQAAPPTRTSATPPPATSAKTATPPASSGYRAPQTPPPAPVAAPPKMEGWTNVQVKSAIIDAFIAKDLWPMGVALDRINQLEAAGTLPEDVATRLAKIEEYSKAGTPIMSLAEGKILREIYPDHTEVTAFMLMAVLLEKRLLQIPLINNLIEGAQAPAQEAAPEPQPEDATDEQTPTEDIQPEDTEDASEGNGE